MRNGFFDFGGKSTIWDLAIEQYFKNPNLQKQIQEAAKVIKGIDVEKLQAIISYQNKMGFYSSNNYKEPRTEKALKNNQPKEVTPTQKVRNLIHDLSALEKRLLDVFRYYDQFSTDYFKLKDKYFTEDENQLIWLKSKVSLSQYFGFQLKRNKWEFVQNLFGVVDLKNDFNSNNRTHSKDYEELLNYLQTTPESI